jgi:DNA-binding NtrC family response regulator
LRERREEIPRLVAHFLDRFSTQYGRPRPPVPPPLEALLRSHSWPGNVRELENCLKRHVLLQNSYLIERELAAQRQAAPAASGQAWNGAAAVLASEPAHEFVGASSDGRSMETAIPDGGAVEEDLVAGDVEPLPRTLSAIAREAVEQAERVEIERALSAARWNRRRAAAQLGVSYKTLLNKIRELGIDAD